MTGPKVTPAVRRGGEAFLMRLDALVEAITLDRETAPVEYVAEVFASSLAAALDMECHEEVQGWTEDTAQPCNAPAVAYREDKWEGGAPPYPVCAKHSTPDLVPLTVAILGGAA